VQRPLWASTGTKNPAYSDVLYVQELIVPGSVNTMPLSTMEAFADHGKAAASIGDAAIADARNVLSTAETGGIDMGAVTSDLLAAGVDAFQKSFDELLDLISSRRERAAVN
jgi:transaldolase